MTKSLTFAIVTTFELIFRNFSVRYKCQSADQFVVIILLILQERKVWLFSVPAKIYDDSILVTKTPLDYIHHEQRGFIWLEFMRQFSRVGFHTTCQITPSLIQLFFFERICSHHDISLLHLKLHLRCTFMFFCTYCNTRQIQTLIKDTF